MVYWRESISEVIAGKLSPTLSRLGSRTELLAKNIGEEDSVERLLRQS